MRFRNSSCYVGQRSNSPRRVEPNSATGKAFHAFTERISGTLTSVIPAHRILHCNQQCSYHLLQSHQCPVETAVSVVQAGLALSERRAPMGRTAASQDRYRGVMFVLRL
jgi:hypothetical protein